jgi:HEAT repeat protein
MSANNINFSKLTAPEIITLLEEPTDDRRPLKSKLRYKAPLKELIGALRSSKTELTRRILCDILADRRAKTAVEALIECLDDPSTKVKNDAAEALGKIGSDKAGDALLNHFIEDPHIWYAIALGAIGYQPAIPFLINALESPSPKIRGWSAWSLGYLKDKKAREALERALVLETDDYSISRIKEALAKLSE